MITLDKRFCYHKQETTTDLINGIHFTITFNDANTSPGDIYKTIPTTIKNFYSSLGVNKDHPNLITTKPPSLEDLIKTEEEKSLLLVFCIAPNTKTCRHHLHLFCYFIHQYNLEVKAWTDNFDRKMRKIPIISSKGNPVYYTQVMDPLDAEIRKENSLMPLYRYLTERKPPSLIHYLSHKNSKNFLFHYVPAITP